MKGIILAAGRGTRLYPMTYHVPKPLLPIYDKPLIYYPLSVLIQMGIDEVLVIVPPDTDSYNQFWHLLGDGSKYGISITYMQQQVPRGIADAFIIAADWIDYDNVVLALGDNIFFNNEIHGIVTEFKLQSKYDKQDALILGYRVNDPWRFGVVEFDSTNRVISLEEKPIHPKSNYIVPGLYYYPNDVVQKATEVKPSKRGELEITSVNEMYLQEGRLRVELLSPVDHWYDTGTAESMLEASLAIRDYQMEYGKYVGCLEEEAYEVDRISLDKMRESGQNLLNTNYGSYLMDRSRHYSLELNASSK